MKKKFGLKKITVLCPRTQKILPRPSTSFGRAFSAIFPILAYYIVSTMVVYCFAYSLHWMEIKGGTFSQIVIFLGQHSLVASIIIKVSAMVIGCVILLPAFLKETPVFAVRGKNKVNLIWVGLLGGFFAVFINAIFSLLKITENAPEFLEVIPNQFAFPLWTGILVYGIVSPIAEEIVFRGIVYNRMRRMFSYEIAFLGSAFLFGIYHGNWVQAAYGFLLGLVINWMYERYGSFWFPVVFHGMANSFVYICMKETILKEWAMSIPGILINLVAVVLCFKFIFTGRENNGRKSI